MFSHTTRSPAWLEAAATLTIIHVGGSIRMEAWMFTLNCFSSPSQQTKDFSQPTRMVFFRATGWPVTFFLQAFWCHLRSRRSAIRCYYCLPWRHHSSAVHFRLFFPTKWSPVPAMPFRQWTTCLPEIVYLVYVGPCCASLFFSPSSKYINTTGWALQYHINQKKGPCIMFVPLSLKRCVMKCWQHNMWMCWCDQPHVLYTVNTGISPVKAAQTACG